MNGPNDPLEESFLYFARPIAADLRAVRGEEVPHVPVPTVEISEGTVTARPEIKADIGTFLQTRYPEPHTLPGAAECINRHLHAGLYMQPPMVSGEASMAQLPRETLVPMLAVTLRTVVADAAVHADNALNVTERDLIGAYRRYRAEWEIQQHEVEWDFATWPLAGLVEQLDTVRTLTPDQVEVIAELEERIAQRRKLVAA